MTRNQLGAKLKQYRIFKGLSLSDSGLRHEIAKAIEAGDSNYSIDSLLTYCNGLDIEIDLKLKLV